MSKRRSFQVSLATKNFQLIIVYVFDRNGEKVELLNFSYLAVPSSEYND